MKLFYSLMAILFSVSTFQLSASGGHALFGADYGDEGSKAYTASPSSFDRDKFLNPWFLPFLENVNNLVLLDAGCGPGHFAIYAAQRGARAFGVDINEPMIHAAIKEVWDKGLTEKVTLEVGDVKLLPYDSEMFDRTISINVVPNLPSSSVDMHFRELHRVLKKDGEAVITIPVSLGIIFTNGLQTEEEVGNEIDDVLKSLPINPTPAQIYDALMMLKGVVNATFVIKDGRLTLVTDVGQLNLGQEIWRKLSVLVVPNYYHSEQECIIACENANLVIEKIERPHFSNEMERLEHNLQANPETQFGSAYVDQGPYALFFVKNV